MKLLTRCILLMACQSLSLIIYIYMQLNRLKHYKLQFFLHLYNVYKWKFFCYISPICREAVCEQTWTKFGVGDRLQWHIFWQSVKRIQFYRWSKFFDLLFWLRLLPLIQCRATAWLWYRAKQLYIQSYHDHLLANNRHIDYMKSHSLIVADLIFQLHR